MVTIGVLVRVDQTQEPETEARLGVLEGVQLIPLEEPHTLGAVIQAEDLDEAHERLVTQVQTLPGVLCAWPLHTELASTPPSHN